MTSDAYFLLNEVDPDKKNYEWASNCITSLRINWVQLKNAIQARNNRAIMYSMQPLTEVMNSFDDEDFKKSVKFDPIPVLEPLVNSVVEDMVKSPPRAELRAEDPTALIDKKEDLQKLKYRKILERDRTELQQRIGINIPYKVPYENFNGNVEEFDKMGLDENDSDDLNFYEQNYQRLWYEIGGQSLINNILKYSQFDEETLRRMVKDIFWAKAICLQMYVDQTTGQIRARYVDPQICWGIFGDSNSGKDDICRGWQDTITVIDWVERVGDDFNFERDWRQLLWAINYCTNQKFTGFIRGTVTFDCCNDGVWMDRIGCGGTEQSNLLSWSNAYKYKVYVGYVEFRTWEATSTKITNEYNKDYVDFVPYSYTLKKKQIKEGYQKESHLQQQWYSTYFLATSSISQYLYKFQKVYYQHIEGANDEYSNGTLCYYQEEGKSAVEIAKVYLQMVNFCYYRMLWIIYKAKPDADEFIWEEMLTLAQNVRRDFPQQTGNKQTPGLSDIINNLVKEMRAKHVRFRTYARVDGKPVLQIPPIERQGSGGLDPLAIAMQQIMVWAEGQIAQKIGINPMRIGANPPSRESTASENRTLDLSYQTTGYMYRMIQYIKEHLAITSLNYATDILQYPDTLPYKWIERLMGNESFQALKSLGKISPHKYGLYVQDINVEYEKQRLYQAADIALSKGSITLSQWGIIMRTTNPVLGFKILAHLELKTRKRERNQALQDKQIEDVINKNSHEREMMRLEYDRGTRFGVAERVAMGQIKSAEIQSQGRIDVKKIQTDAEPEKQQSKAQADIEIERNRKNLEEQEPFPV